MTKHCSNSNPRKKNYLQPSPLWSREPTKQLTVTYNERVIIKCPYHLPMMANQQNMLRRSYNKIVFYHTIKTDRHEPQFWLLQNFDLSKISPPPFSLSNGSYLPASRSLFVQNLSKKSRPKIVQMVADDDALDPSIFRQFQLMTWLGS